VRETRPRAWLQAALASLVTAALILLPWWTSGYLLSALDARSRVAAGRGRAERRSGSAHGAIDLTLPEEVRATQTNSMATKATWATATRTLGSTPKAARRDWRLL